MTGDLFSSESVTRGHPDKLCDTVSDAIVDACLAIDSNARVAVETCVKGKEDKGLIVLAGEVSLNGNVPDYEKVARDAAAAVGYTSHAIGMDATTSDYTEVQVHITTQSAYIRVRKKNFPRLWPILPKSGPPPMTNNGDMSC